MSHTEGRLEADGMYVISEDGPFGATLVKTLIADLHNSPMPENELKENARRLVACWNACEGLPTEALENLPVPIGAVLAGSDQQHDELVKAAEALRDFVKKDVRWNHERDRLLANLDAVLDKDK